MEICLSQNWAVVEMVQGQCSDRTSTKVRKTLCHLIRRDVSIMALALPQVRCYDVPTTLASSSEVFQKVYILGYVVRCLDRPQIRHAVT